MSTRTIVEKADIAVANLIASGGYLNSEQADKFIELINDEPTIINQARMVVMSAPKRKIEKIGFGSRILRAAPASTNPLGDSDRAKPDLDMIELETKEIIAEVWIPYDVLEDNIERGGLENTIMSHITKRAALDLEELLILGDTTSGDTYLALMNGIVALTPVNNRANASGITDVTKDLFRMGIQQMPTKYLRNRALMNFYSSPRIEIEYRDSVSDRATSLGDQQITGWNPQYVYGVPIVPAALMPDDKLWLSYPNNIIFGIQRQISIEADRDIRRRMMVIVLTLRCAIALETADAAVLVHSFKDSDLPSPSTSPSASPSASPS